MASCGTPVGGSASACLEFCLKMGAFCEGVLNGCWSCNLGYGFGILVDFEWFLCMRIFNKCGNMGFECEFCLKMGAFCGGVLNG